MKDLERYQLMQMHRAAELRGGKKINFAGIHRPKCVGVWRRLIIWYLTMNFRRRVRMQSTTQRT